MMTTPRQQLGELLEQVARSLDVPDEVHEEAVRKYEEVGHWLEEQDQRNGRREPKVYPQGSFRLGTVIRPITDKDEYDIDLVYERDLRKSSTTQEKLKDEAGEHLDAFVAYLQESHRETPLLHAGSRCWTLDYPDQFHMDILPAIPDDESRTNRLPYCQSAIHITDRDLSEWQFSNPIGYAEWFKSRMLSQFIEKRAALAAQIKAAAEDVPEYKVKTPLQRAIQILKRHRDFYFQEDKDHRPASIIITTLAANAYNNQADLVDALLTLVRDMPQYIESRVEDGRDVSWVPNPINDNENFADRWQDSRFPERESRFREWLDKVDEDLTASLRGGGIHKVVDLLGSSLGHSVVTKAAAATAKHLHQQSQSGGVHMKKGTGTLITGAASLVASTPVLAHTFYGEMDEK